jgi:ornithine racemase
MYPKIHIHLKKYQENIDVISQLFSKSNVGLLAVTKVFMADQMLVDVINRSHVDMIGDSRLKNLKTIQTSKQKVLLRVPQVSEISDVVKYTDISLQSELEVIDLINHAAIKVNKEHQIILMFDLGDLREGVFYKDDYLKMIHEILKMEAIELIGIGTNLTCYGGVIPTAETYEKLESIIQMIEKEFHLNLKIISGGNSSSIPLLSSGKLPPYINQLRIGEALVLGRETAYGNPILGMHDDVFTLEASIIELKKKPSMPEGILGRDAFGNPVKFFDQGEILRAILAVGRQDIHPDHLIPPKGVEILGASSDHLIVQIIGLNLEVGDTIEFKLTYGGILSLMTSPYVEKHYVKSL